MRKQIYWRFCGLLLFFGCWMQQVSADQDNAIPAEALPAISIVIDDLGHRDSDRLRLADLHGAIVYSILPYTAYGKRFAEDAAMLGRDVLLHLPMQATTDMDDPGSMLTLHMSQEQFHSTLQADLASVPNIIGVNNHRGSLLTRHPGHMTWLMRELKRQGLFFVDSRTTHHTVAQHVADEVGVLNMRRHVFLDHVIEREAVNKQFDTLLRQAKRRGVAVAIGHPYEVTLDVLEERLPELAEHGVELVNISVLLQRKYLLASLPVHR